MGSFSWIRADKATRRKNLTMGDKYKILIPKEFGGGYIIDIYYDYGYIFSDMVEDKFNGSPRGYYDSEGNFTSMSELGINDLYGVLAYWNSKENLNYFSKNRPKNIIDILKYGQTCEQSNRCSGIDIGCYDNQIDELKYPLKLVSMRYNGSYEDCDMRSYGDPEQGFCKTYWG